MPIKINGEEFEFSTGKHNELQKAINRYLQGVRNSLGYKLLYRGIYPGETSGELEDE